MSSSEYFEMAIPKNTSRWQLHLSSVKRIGNHFPNKTRKIPWSTIFFDITVTSTFRKFELVSLCRVIKSIEPPANCNNPIAIKVRSTWHPLRQMTSGDLCEGGLLSIVSNRSWFACCSMFKSERIVCYFAQTQHIYCQQQKAISLRNILLRPFTKINWLDEITRGLEMKRKDTAKTRVFTCSH